MDIREIEELIDAAFDDAQVDVSTRADDPDDDHYVIRVESDEFEGLSLVEQHHRVHDALRSHLASTIHAVEIETVTP